MALRHASSLLMLALITCGLCDPASSIASREESTARLVVDCARFAVVCSSPCASCPLALEEWVDVQLSVHLPSAIGGSLQNTFVGRCPSRKEKGNVGAGLLHAELLLNDDALDGLLRHSDLGLALTMSLPTAAAAANTTAQQDPATTTSPSSPSWTGGQSSVWVDLVRPAREGGGVPAGVEVVKKVHVPHLPAEVLQGGGQLPVCYPVLSFRLALVLPAQPSSWHYSDGDDYNNNDEEEEEEGGSVLSGSNVRKTRHFFPQDDCDDRKSLVIGLAVGLGVAGFLLVCTVVLCVAFGGFQQYRLRNHVGGGGGGGGYGGGGGGKAHSYDDEGLDYDGEGEGRRGGRAAGGGADRSRAATAARSMGRDVDVDVPELGQASPRNARQVNKTTDTMAHLREVDEIEMQPTNSNLPAPLW